MVNGKGLGGLLSAVLPREAADQGERTMMHRFCRYVEKVFNFGFRIEQLQELRRRPRIPLGAIWGSVSFPLCSAAAQLPCHGGAVAPAS
jgi:hypothetical protein